MPQKKHATFTGVRREFRLQNGWDGSLTMHALQRCVREGLVGPAVWLSDLFVGSQRKFQFKGYLLRSLRQILPEEIGLANPKMYRFVQDLIEQTDTSDNEVFKGIIKNIVYCLCASPKNPFTFLGWESFSSCDKSAISVKERYGDCETIEDIYMFLKTDLSIASERIRNIGSPFNEDNDILSAIAELLEPNAQKYVKGVTIWLWLAAQIAIQNKKGVSVSLPLCQVSVSYEPIELGRIYEIPSRFIDYRTYAGKASGKKWFDWITNDLKSNYSRRIPTDIDPLKTGINPQRMQLYVGMLSEYLTISGGQYEDTTTATSSIDEEDL